LPPLLVLLPVPDAPDVPLVPELDLPLVPPVAAQRPLVHGGEQHSVSAAQDEPALTQATGDSPSAPASLAESAAQRPSRQKLPCGQSTSTLQASSLRLHAMTVRAAAARGTRTWDRRDTTQA
jgi:hypothetical protein